MKIDQSNPSHHLKVKFWWDKWISFLSFVLFVALSSAIIYWGFTLIRPLR